MVKSKIEPKRTSRSLQPWFLVLLGLLDLAIFITALLIGHDVELLHPKGLIAQQEFRLIVLSTVILLGVAVPSVLLFYYFAWKYRETNEKAAYEPDRKASRSTVLTIWAIPTAVMVVMACIMWTSTHRLDPRTPIKSSAEPISVQVIAMRWKWVFVYPKQHIATVNYVMLPVDTPVRFDLTADEAPMSSFWIPHLSGQLYAMTGHVNVLNVIASAPGSYPGSSAEINGAGFAGMKFTADVESRDAFDQWTASVRQGSDKLDATAYSQLLKPSEDNPARSFANPAGDLYATVVMKYMGSSGSMNGMNMEQQ